MNFTSNFSAYSFPLLGWVRLPEVKITDEDKKALGLKSNASNVNVLKTLTWQGYLRQRESGRFKGFSEQQVKDRLKMEFEVFEKTGTIDYFLLLWDIAKWCDEQGILRGRGRGSSGGSLAMNFLGITDINSLEHGLHFTRFLSEARLKPKVIDGVTYVDGKMAPDVDSDFQYLRRPEVIKYIEEKYAGKTCKISTRVQFTSKMALKDVLKSYLEYDETSSKSVTDNIEALFGKVEDLDKALEKRKELKSWYQDKLENKRAFEIARGLEGLNVNKGQHPSGVFISYAPLDGNIPVELAKTGEAVTSYDMTVSATLGSKVDILGIRTLDCVDTAAKAVNIKPNDIDITHESIYKYYRESDLFLGLFQIEDGLTKEVVRRIKPRNIDELAACVAISRPGALKYIDQFKEYVQDGILKPIHPVLDELLKPTGGIILYQENITEVCQKLFGMSAVDADQVRYYVGKKLKEEMKKIEPILYEKGRAQKVPDDVIKYFWDTCNASADYLFVKAHAYEYAYLTAQTTYLKANYPREFIFAMMKLSKHEPESQTVLNAIIREAKEMGIDILPPDIIKSQEDFSIEETGVRFGLSHIRGVSDTTMQKLVSFKREFKNRFEIFEAAAAAKINIGQLTGLIYAGVVSVPNVSRSKLAIEAQMYNLLTDRELPIIKMFAPEYNDDLIEIFKSIKTKVNEKGKPYIRESRLETFRRDLAPFWKMYQENSRHEELASYIMERHYLGFSYSNTLFNLYSKKVVDLICIKDVLAQPQQEYVSFIGFVDEVKEAEGKTSKKPYLRFELSDETGKVKAMINGANRIEGCAQLNSRLPEVGDIVCVHGTKADSANMVFVNNLVIQPNPIYLKKSSEKS